MSGAGYYPSNNGYIFIDQSTGQPVPRRPDGSLAFGQRPAPGHQGYPPPPSLTPAGVSGTRPERYPTYSPYQQQPIQAYSERRPAHNRETTGSRQISSGFGIPQQTYSSGRYPTVPVVPITSHHGKRDARDAVHPSTVRSDHTERTENRPRQRGSQNDRDHVHERRHTQPDSPRARDGYGENPSYDDTRRRDTTTSRNDDVHSEKHHHRRKSPTSKGHRSDEPPAGLPTRAARQDGHFEERSSGSSNTAKRYGDGDIENATHHGKSTTGSLPTGGSRSSARRTGDLDGHPTSTHVSKAEIDERNKDKAKYLEFAEKPLELIAGGKVRWRRQEWEDRRKRLGEIDVNGNNFYEDLDTWVDAFFSDYNSKLLKEQGKEEYTQNQTDDFIWKRNEGIAKFNKWKAKYQRLRD